MALSCITQTLTTSLIKTGFIEGACLLKYWGVAKTEILKQFQLANPTEEKAYRIVTNALTGLKLAGDIEKTKPRGRKMRGFIWRLKT